MADIRELQVLERGEEDIRLTASIEIATLKRCFAIDTFVRSFRLHHGLVTSSSTSVTLKMENLLGLLAQRCSVMQLASEGPENFISILMAATDLGTAALMSVSEAYAYSALQPGDLEESLNAVVPYLPLWADNQRFIVAFKHLVACCKRAVEGKSIDLHIIDSTLHALKESCDACGELLAAACSTPVSATTWDSTQNHFQWNVFNEQNSQTPIVSFTPPDTPENSSPPSNSTLNAKTLSMPPRKESVKLAFESVPAGTSSLTSQGVNYELLPSGFMAALDDDVDTIVSAGSSEESEAVSSNDQQKIFWQQNSNKPMHVYDQQHGFPEEEWANMMMPRPEHNMYGSRNDKMPLHWKERPTGFRVVMCRHMDSKGKCKKAGTCTFAHSQEDLERFRSLFIPTERCNYGAKCVYRNKNCQYSHTPGEQHRSIKYYNLAVAQACVIAV